MNKKVTTVALPLSAGILFAMGLTIGGMTQPSNVLAFLDVAGQWDPSLALVMIFAIATYAPLSRLIAKSEQQATTQCPALPNNSKSTALNIDRPLVLGAALFGTGWGLAGYCPGPALTSLGSLSVSSSVFVAALLLGMLIHALQHRRSPADTQEKKLSSANCVSNNSAQ